jgi:hypothetical protein
VLHKYIEQISSLFIHFLLLADLVLLFLFQAKYRQCLGKKNKYGLDFKAVSDSEKPYTYQSIIYAGKPKGKPSEHYRYFIFLQLNPPPARHII